MKLIYFTHAHDSLNLSDFHPSAEHKDILIEVSKPNSFGYHSFSLDEQKKHYEISQNIFFYVQFIQFWDNMRVRKC